MVRAHPTVPRLRITPRSQHLTDRPAGFAPPEIQKAAQMALRMVALNRAADGRWFARKGIPEDVREDYQRLYGHKREAHLKLPAGTPKHEAKARLGGWEAEVETHRDPASPKELRGSTTHQAQRNRACGPLVQLVREAARGRSREAKVLAGLQRSRRVECDPPRGA